MREIVLSAATTGLDPESGDRLIEIGAVELYDHIPTGRTYHQYINPERIMPQDAYTLHDLSDDFLRDKPIFSEVGHDFVGFVSNSQIVIHDAPSTLKFLNAELKWIDLAPFPLEQAFDTMQMVGRKFPGSDYSLDALRRRFDIDSPEITQVGTLHDAELLAEIYYNLGDFQQLRAALSDQASLIFKNASAVSLSAKDTAKNLRVAIEAHLNESGANQLSGDLEVFEHLAAYFEELSSDLLSSTSKKNLEDRVKELERIVRDLVENGGQLKVKSAREIFVGSFIETCGSTAAVAIISGGTLVLGRYAPSAIDSLMNLFAKP